MKVIAIKDFTAYWNTDSKKVTIYDRENPAVKEGTIFEINFENDLENEKKLMIDQLRELGILIPFSEYRQNRMNEVLDDDTKTQE
jgi:hypothetical protein